MAEQKKEGAESVMPYGGDAAKGGQVEKMFDSIAPAYDLMNGIMSFGMCRPWRNRALRMAAERLAEEVQGQAPTGTPDGTSASTQGRSSTNNSVRTPESILDVATGTGDVAFALHARYPQARITGLDLSEGMLEIARKKSRMLPENQQALLSFRQGDSLKMDFPDDEFDMITVAYGVRNFGNLRQGYSEMFRVLKPGGVLCVIELSQPTGHLPLLGYRAYTRGIIPIAGRLISGDPRAYSYLHESIEAAPQRGAMTRIMEEAGFREARWKSLFPGAVTIYTALR